MIYFTNEYGEEFTLDMQNLIERAIEKTLEFQDKQGDYEVSVLICNDDAIQKINKEFRHIDKPTDVLSFPLFEGNELGDIVISMERAKAQAREYEHSLEREVAFLTAHSVLHLLGYDHEEKEQEKIMFAKQEKVLELLDLRRL